MIFNEGLGEADGVELTPQEFKVLLYLDECRTRYCATGELWRRCWPDTVQREQIKRVMMQLREKGFRIINRKDWGWRLIE